MNKTVCKVKKGDTIMSLENATFIKMPDELHERFRVSASKDDSEHPPVRYDSKGNRIYGHYTISKDNADGDTTKSGK